MKFGFDWSSGFRGEEVWKCERTTYDGYTISSPCEPEGSGELIKVQINCAHLQSLLFQTLKFKPLATTFGCISQFVSGLVGNPVWVLIKWNGPSHEKTWVLHMGKQRPRSAAQLTHVRLESFLWDISKQNSPRCDAAKRGVPSGAILFAHMFFIEKWNKIENLLLTSLKLKADSSKW